MSKVAVVTGAGRGIGRSIAIELASRGFDVALLGLHVEGLEETSMAVAALGRRAVALQCDVAIASDVERAAADVTRELGTPFAVINNAGVVTRASLLDTTEAEWDATIDINLKGAFLITRAFLRKMLEAKRGRIIAIGSISSTLGTARLTAYCASKWGIVGFTKALAEELRGTGVQTACILPGSVDTEMLRGSGFDPQMKPDDVAKLVAYSIVDAPDAMNGSAIEMFGA
jgi:3-oxoacyl-[acyl-carrier protein] reductase